MYVFRLTCTKKANLHIATCNFSLSEQNFSKNSQRSDERQETKWTGKFYI